MAAIPHRREAAADELDRIAKESGDRRFAHAARVLRQRTGGRPPIAGDDLAIDEAEHLVDEGRAKSLNRALLMVAKATYPLSRPKSVAERLRRKISSTKPI